jgi:hypothetical protein
MNFFCLPGRLGALALALATSLAYAQPRLEAAASAKAGSDITVTVSGAGAQDFVTIMPKGTRIGGYDAYQYAGTAGALKLRAPTKPGEYEIRLLGANPPYPTLAWRSLVIDITAATLEAPAQVAAGAKFQVAWTGPKNDGDYVGIGDASPKEQPYITYVYAAKGSPLTLSAPDKPGDYELRYFLAAGGAVIASRKIAVAASSAGLQAPVEAVAGSTVAVKWTGPNNPNDYVTVIPRGAHEGASGNFAYTARGNPVSLPAPLAPGDYEVRYSMGQSHATLARAPIRITPGKQEPGLITASAGTALPVGSAVEVILDASGSMLLRIGKQSRIDIAKQTLTKLTTRILPAGTPFALRVFGREIDSCQTDLDIALGPLDPAAVAAKIDALKVKSRARTPIGASLERVAEDLAAAKGERQVILLTDGEETCGGDAAAAVEKLKKSGVATRINIVGFAIDDRRLEATFRHLAESGNGSYFNAKDAAGLDSVLAQALRPGFEVLNAGGQVVADGVAGGEPVRAMPGSYTVRIKGQAARAQAVTVKSRETSNVKF